MFQPHKDEDGESFDQAIFIPKHLCRYVMLEKDSRPLDPNLEKMIEELR